MKGLEGNNYFALSTESQRIFANIIENMNENEHPI